MAIYTEKEVIINSYDSTDEALKIIDVDSGTGITSKIRGRKEIVLNIYDTTNKRLRVSIIS